MLISLLILVLIAAGGAAISYAIFDDEPLMWRLASGVVIGSAVIGTLALAVGALIGFTVLAVLICLVLTAAPAALFLKQDFRSRLVSDWQRARKHLDGANAASLRGFIYYLTLFVVVWLFFVQAVYELKDGIYTGGSQNLGDLGFHLGAIFAFTSGGAFPPPNPSWAGAKFAYPFVADLVSAIFVRLGVDFKTAIVIQDIVWTFSLAVVLERFAFRITKDRLAGRLAPWLLFLSGGLGFAVFARDYWTSGKDLISFLANVPHDYTITDVFRWGDPMVVLFMTQRSLVLGMPLAIIAVYWLWTVFSGDARQKLTGLIPAGVLGLVTGTLVLVHLHSLAALFVITAVLFVMKPGEWAKWVAFGVGTAVVAVPELIWSMTGSATEVSKFVGWNFGWDKGESGFVWFWFINTGILLPVIAAAVILLWLKPGKAKTDRTNAEVDVTRLLQFYIPFALLFVISNAVKLAPWSWDNIKVLIYWYVGSLPLIGYLLAWLWRRSPSWGKPLAVLCLVLLTASGAIDVWRTIDGQTKMLVFDSDSIKIAEQIRQKTDPNALFLNGPTYKSAVLLSGRGSLMRYSGHLFSYGIDYGERENDVKTMYSGSAVGDSLLKRYNVDYVLVSPEERDLIKGNEQYFSKYPVVAEAGDYRVYKVK